MDQFSKMMRAANPTASSDTVKKSYVTYALREGSDFEKTRLVRNLDTMLALDNKTIIPIET